MLTYGMTGVLCIVCACGAARSANRARALPFSSSLDGHDVGAESRVGEESSGMLQIMVTMCVTCLRMSTVVKREEPLGVDGLEHEDRVREVCYHVNA